MSGNMNVTTILDKHAPQPWYKNTLRETKCMRRRCERKYNKSKLPEDKQTYFKRYKSVMLNYFKSKYISFKIKQHEGNSKEE